MCVDKSLNPSASVNRSVTTIREIEGVLNWVLYFVSISPTTAPPSQLYCWQSLGGLFKATFLSLSCLYIAGKLGWSVKGFELIKLAALT
jgi:hypothetical protein